VNSYYRYGALIIGVIVVLVIGFLPLTSVVVDQWSRRDVELRSRLVFNSIQDQIQSDILRKDDSAVSKLFDRLADDERLVGIMYCDDSDNLLIQTKSLGNDVACKALARSDRPNFSTINHAGRRLYIATFPISAGDTKGHVAILHDLSFIEARAAEVRFYWVLGIVGVGLAISLLAAALMFFLLRQWLASARQTILDARKGGTLRDSNGTPPILGAEIQKLVRDLKSDAATGGEAPIQVDWSPETLRKLIEEELPDVQVIAVSNREPYIHNKNGDTITVQTPASGLVTALEPVMRACGGTWVAHGSGTADRETVDRHDRVQVPPDDPAYLLRRIWLSDDEQDGYYYGMANEGLWPLCHISFVRPSFREANWVTYQEVNERFADAVEQEARVPDPIVLVQDYHFATLPAMIRKRLPRATIITFWHIPWPNSETFGICPWREEIIRGLLGSSILGFHTRFHCNNFLETVDRFIESRIDRENASVTLEEHECLIRPYPISIDWPPAAMKAQKPVPECRRIVRERLGIDQNAHLAIGVERFDYTKGVVDRMHAVDDFLTRHPEWIGRFVLVQVAAPTRTKLDSYRKLQDEAVLLAEAINEKHGSDTYKPIILVIRHHEPAEVFELFRAADVCVVSSLHDGMNLVAKEFVAARDDDQGVLILSQFAGASRELQAALLINPYDAYGTAEAFQQALTMPEDQQRERMQLMRTLVRERNVYRWAAQMLVEASRLRNRQRILEPMQEGRPGSGA
jgi:trehalose 6-phosphate synthase